MCGVAGALSTRLDFDCQSIVQQIVADQHTRGPDARVVEQYDLGVGKLVFGHNRLSIIDLTADANQPMSDSSGRFRIVYNGEIYNYVELRAELEAAGARFRTKSDTEVILESYKAWGKSAFTKFIGMFAFAIFDFDTREVLLVRDRFGVKPLYFWASNNTLVFASRPTIIAASMKLKPNLEYVDRGIRYKYYEDDSDISPYIDVRAVEASGVIRIRVDADSIRIQKERFYDFRSRVATVCDEIRGLKERQLEERLMSSLESACRLRLRSDVELGISISGGTDSSTIAAIAAPFVQGLTGYSFSKPDQLDSEGPMVEQLSEFLGIQARYIWPTAGSEVIDLFWKTLRAQDSPFPHPTVMAQYAVFAAARAGGKKVLLGGQGGDEGFMGYRKYFLFYAQSILREKRLKDLPYFFLAALPLLPSILKRATVFFSERHRYSRSEGMGTRLLLPTSTSATHLGLAAGATMRERQVLDITRFSLPTLLRYEDRNSMGNSVESRLPFMDQRILEFGVALSERAKLRNGFGKWILRSAVAGRIPDAIRLNRDKRGFDLNKKSWIQAGLGVEIRDALNTRKAGITQWLPTGADLDELFSDRSLAEHPQAFKEAVSLLWAADRI